MNPIRKNAVLLGMCALMSSTAVMAADHDSWPEVWRDDFNGTELNTKYWNIETNTSGGGNWELQYYGPQGVSVVDGNLVITASRTPNSGRQFTSGRINSKGKIFFSHGKLEARIMIPKSVGGIWPAFWMLGENIDKNPWPQCGEIDILEMGNSNGFGGNEETYFSGACHWGFYNSNNTYPMYGVAGNAPYSLQDGEYHLFTCVWDEDYIRMYLDLDRDANVAPYYEMSISDMSSATSAGLYLHKPFHILFNLAVGGMFTGIMDAGGITASMPAQLKVDWVRICQPDNEAFTFCEEYQEKEEDVEDPNTKPGLWGSASLDSDGNSTFDWDNADDFVLIGTSAGVQEIMKGLGKNIAADYNVDDVKNFFYVWEGTYNAISSKGVNSFGLEEEYQALEVGTVGWSGAGFASTGGTPKDLSMLEGDDWVLHFAMKGNDVAAHRKQTVMVGNTQFVIGRADGTDPSLGDYPRDGKWYSFDIPLKVLRTLKEPLFTNPGSYSDNVVAFLSGAFGGAKLQFDNVFFYRSATPVKDIPDTDTETEIGRYASKSLDAEGNPTFDFENSYDYVFVSASDLTRGAAEGKVLLDLNVDGGKNTFYNWLYEFTNTPTYEELPAEKGNSMGEDSDYYSMSVRGEQAWSGCGFKLLEPQDLSVLDENFWFHIAFKGDDVLQHASQVITLGKVQFIIGSSDGVTPSLGDYRRDGEWYSFDIPLKDLLIIADPLYPDNTSFSDNIVAISTGGVTGAKVQFDNVFFYRNDTRSNDDRTDDTPCGPYVHAALDASGNSTFDFDSAEDIVAVNISDGVREKLAGKIRADYNVDDTNVCFYVWEQTYDEDTAVEGPNSFGMDEGFPALVVGSKNWSGAAYKFESPRDLSMLSESGYYLHLAMRSADYVSHTPYKMGLCEDAVWFTTAASGDGLVTDFPRDGKWYYLDIPVSALNAVAGRDLFVDETSFTKNLLHFDCGARQGTKLQFDNMFFWRNTNPKRDDNLGTSGIEAVYGEKAEPKVLRGIYTIEGRRLDVDRSQLSRGFYIIDGKKVFIR